MASDAPYKYPFEPYIPKTERMKLYQHAVSGARFYPALPEESDIRIDDIAWSLAHTTRYLGHTEPPINVAAHSIVVMSMVRGHLSNALWLDKKTQYRIELTALMHDAQEAYLGDIAFPTKVMLPDFQALEEKWVEEMGRMFPLVPLSDWPLIKVADRAALRLESDLVGRPGISHYVDYPEYNTFYVEAMTDKAADLTRFYEYSPDSVLTIFKRHALALIRLIEGGS